MAGEMTPAVRAADLAPTSLPRLRTSTAVPHVITSTRIVKHLVGRELRVRYRRTRLGVLWGVVQPLIRFAVLGVVFGKIANLDIENFAIFLFTGIVAWTLLQDGIDNAMTSVLERAELTRRPGLPRVLLPIASVVTAMVDALLALPILLVVVAWEQGIPWTVVLLPIVIAVQMAFVLGVGLLTCSANVYHRDTKPIVETLLTVGFYATPIVYSVNLAPEPIQPWLRANPITTIVESWRAVLLDGVVPFDRYTAILLVVTTALLVSGWFVFKAKSPNFIDEM